MGIGGDSIKSGNSETNIIKNAINEMISLAIKHKPYSQNPPRSGLTKSSLESMDCSEFVSRYLYALGITDNVTEIHTGMMVEEKTFQNAIGSKKIKYIQDSRSEQFVPNVGDIFVWRRNKNGISPDGHTGIVIKYIENIDAVLILESIGGCNSNSPFCSADENFSRINGGEKICCSTRNAVYRRTGRALFNHEGWQGYYRPILN